MNIRFDQSYYLCESGEIKTRAEAYRSTYIRLAKALYDTAEKHGGTRVSIDDRQMLLMGVCFSENPPSGWTKPDRRTRLSRPKRLAENAEVLKYFTPGGCYTVKDHPELEPFFTWLKCPCGYSYTTATGSGSRAMGHWFRPVSLSWYAENGPILLITPDMAKEKQKAEKEGLTVTGNVLDWTPPPGAKSILKEEWALMRAKAGVADEDD